MNKRKALSLLLAGTMVAGLLAGCGNGAQNSNETPGAQNSPAAGGETTANGTTANEITVNFASEPESLDPARNTTVDGSIMINHLFEGLMTWEDSGEETAGSNGTCNNAKLVPGQAESYDVTTNEDGTVTYTFHLRDGIKWSDGKDVTAQDFVFSWQRLVSPDTASDYSNMLSGVVNAIAITNGEMDPSELGVAAPDEKTFEVTLVNDLPYFLEICAFPSCMPVREDVVSDTQWTYSPETFVSNGAYKLDIRKTNDQISMVPNENYYGVEELGPDRITFKLMDNDNAILNGFKSGDLDFIQSMPVDEIAGLIASGDLNIVNYIGVYYVCFNTEKAPFDDPLVREAFTLAIDRNYMVEQITQAGEVPAGGFVPSGVYDAAGTEGEDFRTVGGNYYSISEEDYEANCERARELLAEAGYPNGEGFPVVEYLYNTNDGHKKIAEALQNMWKTVLGVEVTLNNQEWNAFLQVRKDGDYAICRNGWIADYNDPISFLDMWLTGGGNNDAQYSNENFDNLIAQARTETDAAKRMELLHQAEDQIIGTDHALCPIYFYTQKYLLADDIQGMYYTPLGYFFFDKCTRG